MTSTPCVLFLSLSSMPPLILLASLLPPHCPLRFDPCCYMNYDQHHPSTRIRHSHYCALILTAEDSQIAQDCLTLSARDLQVTQIVG